MTVSIERERVRIPLERALANQLAEHCEPTSSEWMGGAESLFLDSLRLEPEQCPYLYGAVRDARSALGVHKGVQLFQRGGFDPDGANASVFPDSDPIHIALQGQLVTRLDRACLIDVIGHELGHHLAHSDSSPMPIKHGRLQALAYGVEDVALSDYARAILRLGEITADRFGLLACRDLDAHLRTHLVFVTGQSSKELPTSEKAYLRQVKATVRRFRRNGGTSASSWSHPEHHIRAYAGWLFSETDLYRELTGNGPGHRTIEDVNLELAPLFQPSLSLRSAPRRVGGNAHANDSQTIGAKLDELIEAPVKATRRAAGYLLEHAGAAWEKLSEPNEREEDELFEDPLEEEERELERRFAALEVD